MNLNFTNFLTKLMKKILFLSQKVKRAENRSLRDSKISKRSNDTPRGS